MSTFFRKKNNALPASVDVSTLINNISGDSARMSITMMSLNGEQREKVLDDREVMRADLNHAFGDTLSDAQQAAGVSALYQASNIEEHMNNSVSGFEGIESDYSSSLANFGQGGDLSQMSVNMQAYEDRDFSKFKDSSVIFNMATAEQDAVSELFFPSLQVSADAPTLRCTLRSTIVQRNVQHSRTGVATDLNRKNLAHAFTDPSILENNSTEVVPVVAADDSNKALFVSASRVAPYDVEVDGHLVKTAPLKVGVSGSLLGLAAVGAYAPEEGYTAYDQLNPRALLSTIAVEVSNGAETSQLSFNVKGLPRANFVKSPQANTNEDFMLKFTTDTMAVSAETLDRDQAVALGLSDIEAGVSLRLRLRVSAELNLNTSTYLVESVTVEVIGAFNAAGPVAIEGALATAVGELQIEGYGVTFGDITRTNSNRSSTGLWVDTTSHVREFAIGVQAPIYHPKPKGQVTKQDVIDSLILSAKAVSTNRGIAAMRNHLDALAAYVDMGATGISSSEMFPGAADEVVPYYKAISLPVKTMLNSVSTHEKADDLRSLFSTVLTHYVSQMLNRSNIETATAMIHGSAKKPSIIIATDPEIAPWLMISGDADLLGRMVEYKVATSVHPDMTGKIIISLASDVNVDGIDPCGFGRRGWITELVATQVVQRGSSSNDEVVIQPRELHTATLPVAIEFTVTELTEALEERI